MKGTFTSDECIGNKARLKNSLPAEERDQGVSVQTEQLLDILC